MPRHVFVHACPATSLRTVNRHAVSCVRSTRLRGLLCAWRQGEERGEADMCAHTKTAHGKREPRQGRGYLNELMFSPSNRNVALSLGPERCWFNAFANKEYRNAHCTARKYWIRISDMPSYVSKWFPESHANTRIPLTDLSRLRDWRTWRTGKNSACWVIGDAHSSESVSCYYTRFHDTRGRQSKHQADVMPRLLLPVSAKLYKTRDLALPKRLSLSRFRQPKVACLKF